jgi:hypothetical protein
MFHGCCPDDTDVPSLPLSPRRWPPTPAALPCGCVMRNLAVRAGYRELALSEAAQPMFALPA